MFTLRALEAVRLKAFFALTAIIGSFLLIGEVAGGDEQPPSPDRVENVTFTVTAADVATLGPDLCLDPAVTTEDCVRASKVGAYTVEGDVTGHGIGIAMGVTGQRLRRSDSLARWVITDSPCGSGTITMEVATLLVVPFSPDVPAVSARWKILPEQGTGDLAGVRGRGTTAPLDGAIQAGTIVSKFTGILRCW